MLTTTPINIMHPNPMNTLQAGFNSRDSAAIHKAKQAIENTIMIPAVLDKVIILFLFVNIFNIHILELLPPSSRITDPCRATIPRHDFIYDV
jgi:hypothetical protein